MKAASFMSGNHVFPDIIFQLKHSHVCESSVCKYVRIGGVVALACEKALPIALSNFHTCFSGIFVTPRQLTVKIAFIL